MHGVIPLLDSPMVLLQALIQILARSMKHTVAQRFAYCSWIGSVPICCYPFRSKSNNGQGLLEKSLGGFHIAFLAQARINQVAIGINGTVEER